MRGLVVAMVALVACEPLPPRPGGPPVAIPSFAGVRDPINTRNMPWLHAETGRVMKQLIETLGYDKHAEVADVVLDADDYFGLANAFAVCDADGHPVVAITDKLLEILARLAAARAMEEVFQVDATEAYIAWSADHPLASGPPDGREDPAMWNDRRKLARQRVIFDESVGWVVGHELAHHYLGHIRCDGSGGLIDAVRDAARAIVPAFQQPDELAADAAGIDNLLHTAKRLDLPWDEGGALVMLEFFARQNPIVIEDLLYAFAMTHPPAQLRIPILKATVATWHLAAGHVPMITIPRI